ncbi:MAG: ECF transporter S component [Lachnospiraceae bacterium]|nr:ECF transporter S component [Lachnospiraceae bacterium]
MKAFWESIQQNTVFALQFLAVIIAIFVVAYAAEKIAKKLHGDGERILSTRKIAAIGMLSAISAILIILLEIPVFFAPSFYKLDLSELPALIGGFAFGPVAGVMIELIKILLKVIFKPTTTAFVGELANFAVGCSFVVTASIIYNFKKTKAGALVSCIAGTLVLTVFGTMFNAVYLLPKFAELYGMPLEAIIGMGTEINASITDVTSFVIFAVAPLNLIKGTIVSVVTILVYKALSPILKSGNEQVRVSKVQ